MEYFAVTKNMGLCWFSGHESKAMLNNGGPRYKRSKLERRMNSAVAWCVVFLVLMCFAGGLGSGLWLKSLEVHSPESSSSPTPPIFLDNRTNYNSPGFEGFLTFWTFVIILQVSIHTPHRKWLYIVDSEMLFYFCPDYHPDVSLRDHRVFQVDPNLPDSPRPENVGRHLR